MADFSATLKSLGGNRLKVWLQKEDNRKLLMNATLDQKLYILEKWAQAYEGAPFPFQLDLDDDQTGTADQERASTAEAASPPDAHGETPAPDEMPEESPRPRGDNGNGKGPAPEDSLFGKGDIPKKTPAVLMTEQQRFIANLVGAAAKDAPYIESVMELKTALQMLVPKPIVKARPDFSYKWTSVDNLQADLVKFGGIWEIVTRANHSHLGEAYFGDEGAIMWKGQSVLTFTRRSITQTLDKETIREFNLRADQAIQNLDRSYGVARGKEAVRLTISDQTPQERAFGEEDITIHDPNLPDAPNNPEEYYDYGDTGAPVM